MSRQGPSLLLPGAAWWSTKVLSHSPTVDCPSLSDSSYPQARTFWCRDICRDICRFGDIFVSPYTRTGPSPVGDFAASVNSARRSGLASYPACAAASSPSSASVMRPRYAEDGCEDPGRDGRPPVHGRLRCGRCRRRRRGRWDDDVDGGHVDHVVRGLGAGWGVLGRG